jgi:hypothetical protein
MKIQEITAPVWSSRDFYHGTARSNASFDPKAVAYFTTSFEDARKHAWMDAEVGDGIQPYVIRVQLSVQHPAAINEIEMQDLHFMTARNAAVRQRAYLSSGSR